MDVWSIVTLIFVALCAAGTAFFCVRIWQAKGRMLSAAAEMRVLALRWELMGRPDRAAECYAAAAQWERTARPRKPSAPTSTEGDAA